MRNEEEFEEEFEEECSLTSTLQSELGQSPWYVSSIAIHMVILLIMFLIPIEMKQKEKLVMITTDIITPEEIEEVKVEKEEVEKEVIEKVNVKEFSETEIINTADIEIADKFETMEDMPNENALGDPDNISNMDSEFMGVPALMGVGATGNTGGGGKFGDRVGGSKRNTTMDTGGSKKTIDAVNNGLAWLAAHQESDGRWDCKKYGGGGHGGDDVSVTSMAILAFLGDGNSTKFGRYKRNVKNAVEWLIAQQNNDGYGGPHRYTAGLYTMALAEAYGMSETAELRDAAQKAVDWACKSQCPSGGWDYNPNSLRVDTSVTGWWIMALKSAKVAGLHVNTDTFEKATKYIIKATTQNGKVSYSTANCNSVKNVKSGGGSIRMSAVSNCCLQFLGIDRDNKLTIATANVICNIAPKKDEFDFYLTYYQALGLFQMGTKSKYWRNFNEGMKDTLLGTQVRVGTVEENKGSWNPDSDKYGPSWGRVGQTALGVLMMEVYYRFKSQK